MVKIRRAKSAKTAAVIPDNRGEVPVLQPVSRRTQKVNKLRGLARPATTIAIGLLIFFSGWAIGNGRIQLHGVSSRNGNLPSKLDYSSVDQVYNLIKQNYDGKLTQSQLLDGMKEGLAKATGDPYTEYFNPSDAKDFQGQLDGTFEGIGAELGKNDQKEIIIISPLAGYPAEKAGLKPKDVIASIDGKSAYDLDVNEAVDLIRGKAGTTVDLKVIRGDQSLDIKVTREQINIPSVKSEVKDGIGIMTISEFSTDTIDLATKAANDFKAQGVKGVVLDLRGDPGGYLDAAVGVSSLWLPSGKTVLTERRDGVIIDTHKSSGDSPLAGMPTMVLINDGSASASEITAGALHDNNAAKLVGQQSFGKGSVQQPENLPDGALIKITIARWYTPGGKNIDKQGLAPDYKVDLTDDDAKAGNDPQLVKAEQLLGVQ